MKSIGDFLAKFSNIGAKEVAVKDAVILAAKTTLGVSLGRNNIEVRGGAVKISAGSILKNEIFLKKTDLIKKINEIAAPLAKVTEIK